MSSIVPEPTLAGEERIVEAWVHAGSATDPGPASPCEYSSEWVELAEVGRVQIVVADVVW